MRILILVILVALAGGAYFVHYTNTHSIQHEHSSYAGQESRAIKSLSPSDIEELQAGAGWGLAKAAELNGIPGPAHLLELSDEIELSEDQTEQIQELFDKMQTDAIATGQKLIEQEQQLEERFRTNLPDATELLALLGDIGETRSQLRFVHLSTHLKTPAILSPEQIQKYNALRGYDKGDPCENIPEGHSVEMWKKHNGCN